MMKTWNSNTVTILLIAILAIVGIAVITATRTPKQQVRVVNVADAPPSSVTPQASAYSTEAISSPTASGIMSPTELPAGETPHFTANLQVGPSVVAEGTYIPLLPTRNATQIARAALHEYMINKLYEAPATLLAEGTNRTPVPSEFDTDLMLTTYKVEEVDFPQQVSWDAWVPSLQHGLELRTLTFDKAWRVTVKGTGFRVGNSMWYMFADGRLLGECLGGVTIVYDRSLLTEGARLGVSYGFGSRTYLPETETVHFP